MEKAPKCKSPSGPIGATIIRNCKKYECWRNVWRVKHHRMCCHFQKKKFKIGSVIKTVVGDDGCTSSTLTCVENGFKARIDISVQNDCACGTTTAPVTTTASPSCDSGWEYMQSQCYSVQTTTLAWADARTECQNLGGDLASVTSVGVQSVLFNLENEEDVWTGGNDLSDSETFSWIGGEDWTYDNWNTNQPNHIEGQDCVKMKKNTGRWDDVSCTAEFKFACQKAATGTFSNSGGNEPSAFIPF